MLQAHWEDVLDALPTPTTAPVAPVTAPTTRAWHPLRAIGTEPPTSLRRPFHGMRHVPLAVHFAGCQLCSGKASAERAAKCWPAFRQAVRYAEELALRPLGLRHATDNRSASDDAPLLRLDIISSSS